VQAGIQFSANPIAVVKLGLSLPVAKEIELQAFPFHNTTPHSTRQQPFFTFFSVVVSRRHHHHPHFIAPCDDYHALPVLIQTAAQEICPSILSRVNIPHHLRAYKTIVVSALMHAVAH
jgi:hypothetical protein